MLHAPPSRRITTTDFVAGAIALVHALLQGVNEDGVRKRVVRRKTSARTTAMRTHLFDGSGIECFSPRGRAVTIRIAAHTARVTRFRTSVLLGL